MSEKFNVERLRFELWVSAPPYERGIVRWSPSGDTAWPGQYMEIATQLAWEAWCESIKPSLERGHIANDLARRVAYLNHLRAIVGRHAEKNKVGTPMVSDYDLIDATAEEHAEALELTLK